MTSRAIREISARRSVPVRRSWWVALLACISAPAFPDAFEPIRVDAGGAGYTDSSGKVWSADTGYGSGTVATSTGAAISGTNDDPLYQTIRFVNGALDLPYSFTVPNGSYHVKLLFSEIWSGAFGVGIRQFHIKLEGTTVQTNLDVFAEAGANGALVKTFDVEVSDGVLDIVLVKSVENQVISGIEITGPEVPSPPANLSATGVSASQINTSWSASTDNIGVVRYEVERCQGAACTDFARITTTVDNVYNDSGLSASTTYRYRVRGIDTENQVGVYSQLKAGTTTAGASYTSLLRINVGGASYVDSESNTWSADTGFNLGSTATVGNTISGTSNPSLYQSLRWSESSSPELEYSLTVPNGGYQVKLHFAEIYSGAYTVGGRKFDVQLEGSTVFTELDVFAEAGASAALIKTASASVSDGQLNIRFPHGSVQHPFVSAIEVLSESTSDSIAPGAVTGLAATPASTTRINLSWTAGADNIGVAGYAIERCTGASCTDFLQVATSATNSYSDLGLAPAATYRYRVRAYDAAANLSAYSSVASGTTQSGAGADTQPPTAPGGLVAAATAASDVVLQWFASVDANGIDHYRVERCTGITCSDFVQFANVAGPTFIDTTTLPLIVYRYRVRAADPSGNLSGYSTHVSATTLLDTEFPTKPTGLSIAVTEAHKLGLTWSTSTDNIDVTAYLLERCTGSGCTNFAQVAALAVPGYEDNGRPSNTTYRYRVRARDAANNTTDYSNIVTGTTLGGSGGAGTVTYTYDLLGRISHVVEPDGSTIHYTYDANGSITSVVRTSP